MRLGSGAIVICRILSVLILVPGLVWAQTPPVAGGASPSATPPPATKVQAALVKRQQLTETIQAQGQIFPLRRGPVASRAAGIVERLLVKQGDRVKQGDVLAHLDSREAEAALRVAEAEVIEAKAALEAARAARALIAQQRDRARGLQGSPGYSAAREEDLSRELNRAEAAVSQAEARITRTEASRALAKLNAERMILRAPYDGVVMTRPTQPGAQVAAGGVVAELLDDRSFEVVADLSPHVAAALNPDGQWPVHFPADGRKAEVRLRTILPEENAQSRTRRVIFSLSGDMGQRAEGESVLLTLPASAPREVLLVPKDALVARGGGWAVFVITDGKVEPRAVTPAESEGAWVAVSGKLRPGEQVVTRGNERLRPGQAVVTE